MAEGSGADVKGFAAVCLLTAVACGRTSDLGAPHTSVPNGGSEVAGDGGTAGAAMMTGGAPAAGRAGEGGVTGGTGSSQGGDAGSSGTGAQLPCGVVGGATTGALPDGILTGKSDFGNPGWPCAWFLSGCREKQGYDCLVVPGECPNQDAPFAEQGVRTVEVFPIGGGPGQHYKVRFRFSAIVEAKEYQGGTRDQGNQLPGGVDLGGVSDTFYRDGQPVPSSANVWQMTIVDNNAVEARHYFMNSFPPGQLFASEQTFVVGFEKSIVIVGGGAIRHTVHVPNCRSIDNCGPAFGDGCAAPRALPNVPLKQPLPSMYRDPVDNQIRPTGELTVFFDEDQPQPWHSQLGHLRVLSIEQTNDPVSTNYE